MINLKIKKTSGWIIISSLIIFTILLPGLVGNSLAKDSQYSTTLNEVGKEVNENFFDPKFNGIN